MGQLPRNSSLSKLPNVENRKTASLNRLQNMTVLSGAEIGTDSSRKLENIEQSM